MDKEYYTCFICWESFSLSDEKEKNNIISCCRCNHHDYKYAHVDCLKYWVKSSNGSNKKCNICCTPYIIQKSEVPLSHLIKKHWMMFYFYVLFLISMFIITVVTWARYMIPTTVYVVTTSLNDHYYQIENERNISLIYINSELTKKALVILQTSLFIIISFFIGRKLLNYVEGKTNTQHLIGIDPNNQMILVDLKEEDENDESNEDKSKFSNKVFNIFSIIEEKFSKRNNTMDKIETTMV